MILADTSVWIDFLRGADSPHRRALHDLIENDEDVCITGIILTEVLQGIRDEKDYKLTREYLLEFSVFHPEGTATYLEAARIYRDCRKRGGTVRKTVDCVIAAICIENGLILLHKDRDFDLIEEHAGLKCYKV